jgi:hypothetical protein
MALRSLGLDPHSERGTATPAMPDRDEGRDA